MLILHIRPKVLETDISVALQYCILGLDGGVCDGERTRPRPTVRPSPCSCVCIAFACCTAAVCDRLSAHSSEDLLKHRPLIQEQPVCVHFSATLSDLVTQLRSRIHEISLYAPIRLALSIVLSPTTW